MDQLRQIFISNSRKHFDNLSLQKIEVDLDSLKTMLKEEDKPDAVFENIVETLLGENDDKDSKVRHSLLKIFKLIVGTKTSC